MVDALDLLNGGFAPGALGVFYELPEMVFLYWKAMRSGMSDREHVDLAESQGKHLDMDPGADPYVRALATELKRERDLQAQSGNRRPAGKAWGELGGVTVG